MTATCTFVHVHVSGEFILMKLKKSPSSDM